MNIEALKKALKPKLHKIEVEGIELCISRPTVKDAPLCIDVVSVLVYCVKDENGEPVFDKETAQDIDATVANNIYIKVLGLLTVEDGIDEVEKK
ncbi:MULTISPECIES: hypothetical protein [Citrobacter]|uniref:hypothetical protein n=1 Tax=Citrobacter TaxID=544 RepID=UPI0019004DBA|nr:hypothetical protein [Citrobacter sp. FDAARGOS_156]MBJ8884417.1 hypothetical protein [Citrobacter sp. FDAARGOS_156]HED2478358.1 hypothetical protein [Citrobacter youngae]